MTFPRFWANTCCSHPLDREGEREGAAGAKRAAVRKLEHELGIPPHEVPTACIEFVTRIHYAAPSGDGPWGEHEIDYVLFARPPEGVTVSRVPNEVEEARWVSQAQLRELLQAAGDGRELVSPWFRLITENGLFTWWDAFLAGELAAHKDEGGIRRL